MVYLAYLVYFVYLVYLVYLVCLVYLVYLVCLAYLVYFVNLVCRVYLVNLVDLVYCTGYVWRSHWIYFLLTRQKIRAINILKVGLKGGFMDAQETRATKAKITVTLSRDLVRQLDQLPNTEARSRSQVVEEALRRWLEEYKQKELECQVEEYYRSLSKAERQEDKEWTRIAAKSAKRLWDE